MNETSPISKSTNHISLQDNCSNSSNISIQCKNTDNTQHLNDVDNQTINDRKQTNQHKVKRKITRITAPIVDNTTKIVKKNKNHLLIKGPKTVDTFYSSDSPSVKTTFYQGSHVYDLSEHNDPLANIELGLVAMRVFEEYINEHNGVMSEKIASQLRQRFVTESFSFSQINFRITESSNENEMLGGGTRFRGGQRGRRGKRGGRDCRTGKPEETIAYYNCEAEIASEYVYSISHTQSKLHARQHLFKTLFTSMSRHYPVLLLRQYPNTCLNPEYFKKCQQNSTPIRNKGILIII